ncbi:MAG: hypothetical protein IVW55_02005 [Chloroflexi bacterium]|nr:hypothetical protein [Chloroflexota bacterium]
MAISTQTGDTISRGKRWPAEVAWALAAGRRRVLWAQVWNAMAATYPVPLLLAAGWIALARFTLLEIPLWPSELFIVAWLLWLVAWSLSRRLGDGQVARYLDHTLLLDERLTTCMELLRGRNRGRPTADDFLERMILDARNTLRERMPMLPAALHFTLRRRYIFAIVVALVALAAAITVPTPLDAVRAERASLNNAVSGIDRTILALKAQITAAPGLADSTKQSLTSELESLEAQLHTPGADRASLLAAIADTQQKVRELSPSQTSDFDSLVTAARLVQQAAISNAEWDPASSQAPTDLGKAAAAAEFLGSVSAVLQAELARSAASFLSQAADFAAARDPQLAASLTNASGAILLKDKQKAAQALTDAASRFRAAESALQTAQTAEDVQAKLDEGRQGLAQAGQQLAKRPQIGFRRRGSPQASDQANSLAGDPGNQQGTPLAVQTANPGGSNVNQASGAPPNSMGQNMPQYSNTAGSGQGSGSSASNGGSNSATGSTPGTGSGAGNPSGGSSTGTGGSGTQGKPTVSGSSAGSAGGGSGASGGPSSGTFNGAVTGASGAVSGGITQVQNPQGNGLAPSGASGQGAPGGGEKVYVPPPPTQVAISGASPGNGQAAPLSGNADGVAGRVGAGSTTGGTQGSLGAGGKAQVRTPYTEVIGKYASQATDALAHVYVPADAKEYVKEYFTELGK